MGHLDFGVPVGAQLADSPVSSPLDAGLDASVRLELQSETSMVRMDVPTGDGGYSSSFVVSYNDETGSIAYSPFDCWRFAAAGKSLDGWATSINGVDWQRHDQLPPPGDAGVHALHGDPWLASWSGTVAGTPATALYVSIGQQNLADVDEPVDGGAAGPWSLVVAQSRDSGQTFAAPRLLYGPIVQIPDGPKIAMSGDGAAALVVWAELDQTMNTVLRYKPVWNPSGTTMTIPADSAAGTLTPTVTGSCASMDGGVTTIVLQDEHPRVAAGKSVFYVTGNFEYTCAGGGSSLHTVIWRLSYSNNALNAPERMADVGYDFPATSTLVHRLNTLAARNLAPRDGGTFFGDTGLIPNRDRGGPLPALAAGQDHNSEFLVAATVQAEIGSASGEATHEYVKQLRITNADTCVFNRSDPNHCGGQNTDLAWSDITTVARDMGVPLRRPGVWESKPHVFVGKVPDGNQADLRVGIIWYSQPKRGLMEETLPDAGVVAVSSQETVETVVEAVVSDNGGVTYSGPFNMNLKDPNGPGETADHGVDFFYPCQVVCNQDMHHPDGYFGEYISAAFTSRNPSSHDIVGTWADSRQGCGSQTLPNVYNQHVWSGRMVTN